jgi:hypothetical protein
MQNVMATNKKRINISLPKDMEIALNILAESEGVPIATKAVQLLADALELLEDQVLIDIAEERDTPDAEFIPHDEFWECYTD